MGPSHFILFFVFPRWQKKMNMSISRKSCRICATPSSPSCTKELGGCPVGCQEECLGASLALEELEAGLLVPPSRRWIKLLPLLRSPAKRDGWVKTKKKRNISFKGENHCWFCFISAVASCLFGMPLCLRAPVSFYLHRASLFCFFLSLPLPAFFLHSVNGATPLSRLPN